MTRRFAVVAATTAVLIAGCGGGEDDTAPPQDEAPATAAYEPGPFFGECGSITDSEVQTAFGAGPFAQVTRNSVGCQWETVAISGPSVSFSWYRGSPIGRERAGSELIGRPAKDIAIDGNPGFEAEKGPLCEIGVQFGDDFFHWSVTYSEQIPARPPCDVGNELAKLTVERKQ
ncbi:DUF3558 domain-containing protein [Rhodococcus fascians]|nr:DUF3558 domain-containing protein [Rhodococcus fascians]MBY4237234.1 DUF3558 domain-containing protein [Rhodococcus fascians]MBY4252520.1 DUF3558 domain-containing protein [Rhodococcus fascians]MBY4268550.1 DUF3558 domain-containing protein [Rhodococcus fascians]